MTLAVYGVLGVVLSTRAAPGLSPRLAAGVGALPTVIAVINAGTLLALVLGWRAIRARRIRAHRRWMLAAAAGISVFLLLYVTRVALGGTKAFPGPAGVRTYLYLPVLAVHIFLSILSVPLVIYNLLVGLTLPVEEVARTPHPRVGRGAVLLWSVSLSLGLLVYLMLNVFY